MTVDKRRPKPSSATLLPFTPVPRHYKRHDGWTPARQRGFIAALADTGSVMAAAYSVNMTPEGAYHLRRHPRAGEFREAWDHALSLGVQRIGDGMLHRAIHGTEEPVFYQGAQVGTRTKHNDRVNFMIVRAHKPETYGGTRKFDPDDKAALDLMKEQWRAQWQCEQAIESGARIDEAGDAMIERIERMHRHWFTRLGQQARDAYRAFRLAEARWIRGEADSGWQVEDKARAQAEYAEWFNIDDRARIELALDIVMGFVTKEAG